MIRPTTLAELRARGGDLIQAAAAETGSPGIVQWQQLEALERAGWLLLLAVEERGELVGYCCAALGAELFSAARSCTAISLFVRPEHRGRWGKQLIEEVDAAGAARGTDLLRVQAIPGSRLERLLYRLGFRRRSVAFERVTKGQEMQ